MEHRESKRRSFGTSHEMLFTRGGCRILSEMRLNRQLLRAALVFAAVLTGSAQQSVTLTVKVDQPGPRIDPLFYGLMTEEINFSYDGGLYAELIRNRTFR